MAEIRGKFVYDDALRPGEAADGGLSHLLFDNNGKLADHAVFVPDDSEDEYDEYVVGSNDDGLSPEEVGQAIGAVIGIAVVVVAGAVRAAPHVRRWWHDDVTLRLRRLSRTRQTRVGEPLALRAAPADFHRAVEDALDESGGRMSRAEADNRLAAVLAAAAFIADQLRALKGARVDDADLTELNRAMESLMTQEVTDRVNQALKTKTLVLEEGTSNEFMRAFGGGQRRSTAAMFRSGTSDQECAPARWGRRILPNDPAIWKVPGTRVRRSTLVSNKDCPPPIVQAPLKAFPD